MLMRLIKAASEGISADQAPERYGKHAEGLDEDEAALKETREDPVREPGWRPVSGASGEKDHSPPS
jgi:hypothetical protein